MKALALGLAAVALAVVVSACGATSPCSRLAKPTPIELAAAYSGANINRRVGVTECDLINGQWVADYYRTHRPAAVTTVVQAPAPTVKATRAPMTRRKTP